MTHVHVIPVDLSLTAEEAWREVCIFGRRVTYTGAEMWATMGCDGEECRLIEEEPTPTTRGSA